MTQILAATWAGAHQQVKTAGNIAWGSTNVTLPQMAGSVINVALSLLGVVFMGYALYAGFKWMTARGDEKAVTAAKDTIKNSVIGLIIIVGAFALTTFVMKQLNTITTTAPAEEPLIQSDELNPGGENNV
jgi:TRAP-type C4-dicarboxylate transport system permease small subunit